MNKKIINILTKSRVYDIIISNGKKGTNWMKLKKKDSLSNIELVKNLCDSECSDQEKADLKRFYMNKYGGYMSSKIVSILMTEFFIMFLILQFGLDMLWSNLGIAYADTIVYGLLWGSGGIYLLQMVVTIVYDTYYLQLALENGKVYKNEVSIDLQEYDISGKNKQHTLNLYIKRHGKNELISMYINKHKQMKFVSNLNSDDGSGTKFIVYSVQDKRNTMFFMVKDRPIDDMVTNVLRKMLKNRLSDAQMKLLIAKCHIKSKTKK
mgnify:CR=1 FL=1